MAEESKLAEKVKEASKETSKQKQFTKEEINQLRGIQQKYIDIQNNFGQVKVTQIRLEQQLLELGEFESNLGKELVETQGKEQEFIKGITEKYGDGIFNPQTGEFTPKKD